jgi:hypothetical protein
MSRWSSHRERIQALAARPITPAIIVSLRKELGEAAARELIEIASVQSKAVKKFGDGVWMATARAIEQASDRMVAAYKASWMRDLDVIDLCGGIGGDAMGFAARGCVVTVDRDPQMTMMAAGNLRSLNASQAASVCADVEKYMGFLGNAPKRCGIHIDPDRRVDRRRTTDPSCYSPGIEFVSRLAASSASCWIKLAPAAELSEPWVQAHHRQWISYLGSVREQALLCGEGIGSAGLQANERSAVRVLRDGTHCRFASSLTTEGYLLERSAEPLAYLYDFDPAIRAAGLSEAFAAAHSLSLLADAGGFFTSDEALPASPLLQSFKTLWAGPADLKLIKKQLSVLACELQAIKVRGTDHEPAKLLKQLKQDTAPESAAAVLLLGRCGKRVFAVIAKSV